MIIEFKNPYLIVFSMDENNIRNIKRVPVSEFPAYFYMG